ncbi:hypothetical protein B0I35DRAFT_438228 [Stachybotrys elegans]|uniref:Uncharacterized protein n=1 Tax=Stachybotrys elegans TaxID=80388 RepID=A0A8K0SGF3_9HYPO|nr:hypothetical protein B0I35DRAFT_438228 [Stachybotrys elegans]
MDWIGAEPHFEPHDFNAFHYKERSTTAIWQLDMYNESSRSVIDNSSDWEAWLSDFGGFDEEKPVTLKHGFRNIICSRAPAIFDGQAPVSHLPFTKSTWRKITSDWQIHRGITRVITRQVACFSAVHHQETTSEPLRISFLARMSAYLPDDLALSVVFTPCTRSIFTIWYGCNSRQTQKIQRRLEAAGEAIEHPLLTVGIFVELERERLVKIAEDLADQFTLSSEILQDKSWSPETNMKGSKLQEYLALCLQSRNLVDHIRAVKRQLCKITEQVDEMTAWINSMSGSDTQQFATSIEITGVRIKKRIQDVVDEYDDKMDECRMMSENLSLAMQTVYNQIAQRDSRTNTEISKVNHTIALETKRDNAQMRSIALLTMIYVPLSCVASIFSTSLFNFAPGEGETVVSSYFWIFVVVSLGLTAITVLLWHLGTNREVKKDQRNNSFHIKPESMV